MWLIVGLGNPGRKYAKTRHNAGFMVIDEIAVRCRIELKEKETCRMGKGSLGDHRVILLEPLMFMNRSGQAVRETMQRHGLQTGQLIVISDDLDLPVGKLRIRKRGSAGGHRGIESVIQEVGSGDFIRIRIGIGREADIPAEDYVLRKFGKEEALLVREAVSAAADAVSMIIEESVDRAMNSYN